MSNAKYDEYVVGGYFLTRPVIRPAYVSSQLFPDLLLSATSCLSSLIPYSWNTNWRRYGISSSDISELQEWVTVNYRQHIGLLNVFFSVEVAVQFANLFFTSDKNLVIIGIGLHKDFVPMFLSQNDQSRPGEQLEGVATMLRNNQPLAPNGQNMGFEPLAKEYNELSSWFCESVYQAAVEQTLASINLRPNNYGLIDSLGAANQCAALLPQLYDGHGIHLWLPWQIIRYSLT